MDDITTLFEIDIKSVVIGFFTIVGALLFVYKIVEEVCKKIGIEFKFMREKREDHELLIQTSKNLAALQDRHSKDETEFRENLFSFIDETRKENEKLRNEMRIYTENRIKDREVSIDREKRLNNRIDGMIELDNSRDSVIDGISGSLKKLTEMFVDKQINDYRWEIINFATTISDGKPCTRDGFKHCFATYEKYERILEENGLENGEVEISMEIINEAYKEKMLKGF